MIEFDAQQEHVVLLRPVHGEGEDFKMRGRHLGVQISMHSLIGRAVAACKSKADTLLRTWAFYDISDMLNQFVLFKTHVEVSSDIRMRLCSTTAPRQFKKVTKYKGIA